MLATYNNTSGLSLVSTTSTPLNFLSHLGTQGNPHLYVSGAANSVWEDNEKDNDLTQDLFVYELTAGSFPSGTWAAPKHRPSDKLDLPGTFEAMPFFNGTDLYFMRGTTIGCISAVGEPSIAVINGETYLFFIYVVLRAYDGGAFGDSNPQVGFVKKN